MKRLKIFLCFLLFSISAMADLNGCNTVCSPDGAGGMSCNTICPQRNQGTLMDAFNRGREQAQQNQLRQQKLDMLRQTKQACEQGNEQACSEYKIMLMNTNLN